MYDLLDIDLNNINNKNLQEVSVIHFVADILLAKFENDWTISFIPPDGEFDIIKYWMNCI